MPSKKKSAAGRGRTTQSGSRRVSKGKASSAGNRSRKSNNSTVLILFYDFFTGTYFGRIFVAALLLCLILLLNLLISGDRFNWFFVLTGIELIAVSAGGWLYFLLRDSGD